MKCQECKQDCEKSECFPKQRDTDARPGGPGWVVFYCTNTKDCQFAKHKVPQQPRRKSIDVIETPARQGARV